MPGVRAPSLDRSLRLGAALLVIGTLQFVAAMALVQWGYEGPYSLADNQISDLGSQTCGYAYGGTHFACSPFHDLFNGSAILFGVFYCLGAILIRNAFAKGRARALGLSLLVASGVGAVGVGLFPWDVAVRPHLVASLAAFLCGNGALLFLGSAMSRAPGWKNCRALSFLSGGIGIASLVLYILQTSISQSFTPPGGGAVERLIVAPILLWNLAVGQRLRRTSARTLGLDEGTGPRPKPYRGLPMEGFVARWYAKVRGSGGQLEEWKKQAQLIAAELPDGADILEVAPGPGYFAVELARDGRFRVTGLDISRTFVEIARENARRAGVAAAFQRGDVAQMDFPDRSFDLVICQAAFKNFSQPTKAIEEMHRVLREGGRVIIHDMRGDTSDASLRQEVAAMELGRIGAFMTFRIMRRLAHRAYTKEQFERMAAASSFGACEVATDGIGVELRMAKPGTARAFATAH